MKNIVTIILGATVLLTLFTGCVIYSSNPLEPLPKPDTATITTSPVDYIRSQSAVSGGDVISEGYAAVTSKGVCWSTTVHPTAALSFKTVDGAGYGSFTSNITGLTPFTTYYVRAYAVNSVDTAYGSEITFTTRSEGANYGGGVIFYVLRPDDPGYDPNVLHGLVAAPDDQSSGIQWGCYNIAVHTTSTELGTGRVNTTNIVNRCGAGTAAYLCDTLVLGGYNDWYLPSRVELSLLRYCPGVGDDMINDQYWSSSEYDQNNAICGAPLGGELSEKYQPRRVRAIRSF